ncbi:MAG: DNA-3-methyladenine glycosylase I [Rhodocyclales bacterium]|nr:DNA-3-methyladenine glycosylase I [Rhodocyclales bacterium]
MTRCPWCGDDPLYTAYHDTEWGVPCTDERTLFEFLILEGAQAGLSWITILRKRENYRRAFDGFDAQKLARYDETDIARLLADPGIVRNRLKIGAAIANARALLALHAEGQSLDNLLWSVVGGQPQVNRFHTLDEIPAATAASHTLSKELARRGFKFVGPTICYALLQATGRVNDHLLSCPRHKELDPG